MALEFKSSSKDRLSVRVPYSNSSFYFQIRMKIKSASKFRMGVGDGYAPNFYIGKTSNGYVEVAIGDNGGILNVPFGGGFRTIRVEIDNAEMRVFMGLVLTKVYTLNELNVNNILLILGEWAINGYFSNNVCEVSELDLNGLVFDFSKISQKRVKASDNKWYRLESDRDITQMLVNASSEIVPILIVNQ